MSTEELTNTEENNPTIGDDGNKRKRSIDESTDDKKEIDLTTDKKIKIDESQANKPIITSYIPLSATLDSGGDTTIIEVAPDKVGQIIGSKGLIIQEIQSRTGAKAYVNQDFPEGVNRQVKLTGNPTQIKAASDLIQLIIEQGPTAIHMNSLVGGPIVTVVIECTQNHVGKVIGSSGSVIKDIQSRSGAKIQIDQDFPPDVPRKINVTGTTTAVNTATQLIQSVMAGTSLPTAGGGMLGGMMMASPMQYAPGGEMKQVIEVPKSIVGKIIGRGGETITLIQRKSGARVTVDQNVPDGAPCKVLMVGSTQTMSIASQLISELMMGVPSEKIGANLPMPGGGGPMGMQGMGMGMGGYGYPPQQSYGMGGYGMPPQAAAAYGGYYNPQQQQQQPHGQQQNPYGGGGYGGQPNPYGGAPGGGGGYGQQQSAIPPKAASSVWTEHKTDDGIPYWYNASTGVSQWERPKE